MEIRRKSGENPQIALSLEDNKDAIFAILGPVTSAVGCILRWHELGGLGTVTVDEQLVQLFTRPAPQLCMLV